MLLWLLYGANVFSEVGSNKLQSNVKNEIALICAEFGADIVNISKVTGCKTKWPRFLVQPVRRLKFLCFELSIDLLEQAVPWLS